MIIMEECRILANSLTSSEEKLKSGRRSLTFLRNANEQLGRGRCIHTGVINQGENMVSFISIETPAGATNSKE